MGKRTVPPMPVILEEPRRDNKKVSSLPVDKTRGELKTIINTLNEMAEEMKTKQTSEYSQKEIDIEINIYKKCFNMLEDPKCSVKDILRIVCKAALQETPHSKIKTGVRGFFDFLHFSSTTFGRLLLAYLNNSANQELKELITNKKNEKLNYRDLRSFALGVDLKEARENDDIHVKHEILFSIGHKENNFEKINEELDELKAKPKKLNRMK